MKIFFYCAGLLTLLIVLASETPACSCIDPSQRQRFRSSSAVFLGEVTEFRESTEKRDERDPLFLFPYHVTFKVEKQWKGQRQKEIAALAGIDSPGMCGDLDLSVGRRILVYAPRKNGRLVIYRECGPNRYAENAKKEIDNLSNFFFRTYTFFYPFPKL